MIIRQFAITALCALGVALSAFSARAQERLPSQFQVLSPQQVKQTSELRELYESISRRWLELRLDPQVDGDGLRNDLNRASDFLARLESGKAEGADEIRQQVYQILIDVQIRMLPSRRIEQRGALLDAGLLMDKRNALPQMMKRLKAAGFNAIYPEVFRRGYALFPNPLVDLDPALQAGQIDLLDRIMKAAREADLEVYPWFWVYRVLSPSISRQNPLVKRLPALLTDPLDNEPYRSSNGEIEDESRAFMSPASVEWRELMSGLMRQVASEYAVQGFMLDYIRYGNNQTEDELSMTRFQLDYFRKVGHFPTPRVDPASSLQSAWHLWREEQVNAMVRGLNLQLSEAQVDLTAAVFRNEIHSRNTKMQNWRHWSDNNWLKYVSPMMYTEDYKDLDLWMEWETDNGKRHDLLYPILGAHKIRGNSLQLLNQIASLQKRNASGYSIFAMREVSDPMLKALQRGPFRFPAAAPHHHLPRALYDQFLLSAAWLDELVERGAQTQSIGASSRSKLKSLASHLKQAAVPLKDLSERQPQYPSEELLSQIQKLREEAENATRAFPLELRQRLLMQMGDLEKLSQVYAAHLKGERGYVKPTKPPSTVSPEAKPLPQATVPYVNQPPRIDSRLSDPAWKNALVLPRPFLSTGSGRSEISTEIRLAYDDEALYIAYVNDEPRTDRMHISSRSGSDFLHADDTVQVFLNPVNARHHYYYFVANPIGLRYQRASFDNSWARPWQSATRQFAHGWIAELAIPFASMNVQPPLKGQAWRGNFCRRRPQDLNDFHCWSFTFGGVHRIDRFGKLNFEAPTPNP